MKNLATFIGLATIIATASPVHATNQITDAGGVGYEVVDPVSGQIDGVVSITTTAPDNAVIKITVGSACSGGMCNMPWMYVGFTLDSFAGYQFGPACQATLQEGAFHSVAPLISRADTWPIGSTVLMDYDLNFRGAVYYLYIYGPPQTALDNPDNPPAAVFVPGRQLRVNVMCAPK